MYRYRTTRTWIPPTDAGVRETLRVMADLSREDPTPLQLDVAAALLSAAGGPWGFPRELRRWLEAHVPYEDDPYGVELVRAPGYALELIHERGYMRGDCDDAATLAAALAETVGAPWRFVLLAWAGPFSHVYAEVADPQGRWLDMDIHRPPQAVTPPTREEIVYP